MPTWSATTKASPTIWSTYNADGYYDDGMEIVRKGTASRATPNGKGVRRAIVFRNKRTGKSYTRAFDDTTDLWSSDASRAGERL